MARNNVKRDEVVVPATTEPLKFTVTLECHFDPSNQETHVSGYGGMYDPSMYGSSKYDESGSLAFTIQHYVLRTISGLMSDITDSVHVKITNCPDSWYSSHKEAMRQIKEIKEKQLSEEQKRLLAQESELRAKLAEIEKLKKK